MYARGWGLSNLPRFLPETLMPAIIPTTLLLMASIVTLAVFVPFAVLYMGKSLKLDYLWAGLCMVGAAYFMFRGPSAP